MKQLDLILLWVRAGGACAVCKTNLLMNLPTTGNINLGEMAHIIPRSTKGPRGNGVSSGSNSYENLILLCPTDHTIIDKAPNDYPREKLLELKKKHESLIEGSTFATEAKESLSQLLEASESGASSKIVTKLCKEGERHFSYSSIVPKVMQKMLGNSHGYYNIGISIENIGSNVANRVSIRLCPLWKTIPSDVLFSVKNHITRNTDTCSSKLELTAGPINVGETMYFPSQFYINYRSTKNIEMPAVIFEYYITCDDSLPAFGEIEIAK